jgi:two-component system, NarL family, sensor histidine kinase DesK
MLKSLSPQVIGWEVYIHLIWLCFLVFQPLFDPNSSLADWLVIAGLIAAFLPLYFWSWVKEGRQAAWGIGLLTLLGLLGAPYNSGSAAFLIYAASAAGFKFSLRQAPWAIAAIWLSLVPTILVTGVPWPYMLPTFIAPGIFIPLIGGFNLFYAQKERSEARLRMANSEIARLATIAERERIARDLHDLLGHTLSVITLKAELAGKLIPIQPERAQEEIAQIEATSRQALSEVRAAVTGYRAKGFMAEIAGAKLALEAAGVRFSFGGDVSVLTPLQETVLSLVVREAVTNIIRHANASEAVITLAQECESTRLEISDNGQLRGGVKFGNGLSGIRDRLASLGGNLSVTRFAGTTLIITLPTGAPETPELIGVRVPV